MERLKIVLFIAALVATAHTSTGQLLPAGSSDSPSASPESRSYVVIGDVRNFNYFPLREGTTVRQAVLAAGILSDSVSVSVIRAAQDRSLWTQVISPTTADSGEVVKTGDILMVQSMLPTTEPVQKNAALRTDDGVVVVALTDEAIVVGDVLLQTNNQPSPGQQLRISSRFQGRTAVANASLSDPVAHGDVVTFSAGNQSGLQGFGGPAPVCSEWQEPDPGLRLPVPAPQTAVLQDHPSEMCTNEQLPGMPVPVQFSDSAAGSSESVTSREDQTVTVADPDVFVPLAVQSVSQENPHSDDDMVVAPQPPAERLAAAVPVRATAASPAAIPWNILFIAALLIAGTLLLAGSLRADEAMETEESRSKEDRPDLSPASSPSEKTVIRDIVDRPHAGETTPKPLPSPSSLAAGNSAAILNPEPEIVIQGVGRMDVTPAGLVTASEWFDKDWLNRQPESGAAAAVIGESSLGMPESGEAVHPPQALPEIRDEAGSGVLTDGFTDLEDLLQNRLPIDLCETRLPLRIVLFGRPAGPRRLRVDAAHATLPAPHMNRSAERKREEPVAVSETVAEAAEQTTGALGSLDRALYHLQERTDS